MIHSLAVHALIAGLSLFLFIVLRQWWKKKGEATRIYKINCWLMFGLFISHSMAFAKYVLVLIGWEIEEVYVWYFSLQQYFIIIPLLAYVEFAVEKLKGNHSL